MTTKLKTKFHAPGDKTTKLVAVPEELSVQQVIELMNGRLNRSDLGMIRLGDRKLPPTSLFKDWYRPNTVFELELAETEPVDTVKQVVFVCFDESGSMNYTMDGYEHRAGEQPKLAIAKQYLTTFAKKLAGSCILGLISFNDDITTRCPLGCSVADFEEGMNKITPESTTHLWDALNKAANELVQLAFDAGRKKKEFENTKLRILVISDGDDVRSAARPWEVCEKLCKYDIVVDSVIVSSEDSCKKLNALCHMTGGMSCRPATVEEGLALFEQDAFLDLNVRQINGKHSGVFDQAALKNMTRNVEYDKVAPRIPGLPANGGFYTGDEVADDISPASDVVGGTGKSLTDTISGLYLS